MIHWQGGEMVGTSIHGMESGRQSREARPRGESAGQQRGTASADEIWQCVGGKTEMLGKGWGIAGRTASRDAGKDVGGEVGRSG